MSNWVIASQGRVSWFGGPNDNGVGKSEGLGLIEVSDLSEWWFRRLFNDVGPGLARSLNPNAFYVAMRFGYGSFGGIPGEVLKGSSREQVRRGVFRITANGKSAYAQAADWGPNTDTGRSMDLSPGLLSHLSLKTDDSAIAEFCG